MDDLTFDDYKNRISIQDVLLDAGYQLYRRDGLRWPSYCRTDNDGRRIPGDKFIVCANGMACFQPPETKKYNVISFIAEHPHFFPEGNAGKDPYTVVNEVCHRLLNIPIEVRQERVFEPRKETKSFTMEDYKCKSWTEGDWKSQTQFFPFFKPRAITRQTQKAFSEQFMLTSLETKKGKLQALSFPMRIPGTAKIVGLEQRGNPDKDGKISYKGMARGTNATEGLWFAIPNQIAPSSSALGKVKDVYWFESALDAMAYYQTKTEPLKSNIAALEKYDSALYVSTGGSPSLQQLKGILMQTGEANQHACFDNDKAGHVFAIDLLLTRAGRDFQTSVLDNGQLQIIDQTDEKGKKYTLNLDPFEFDRIAHVLGVGNPDMKDYVESMSNPQDIKSGDYDMLPSYSHVSDLYNKIYAINEQYHSGELLQGIPPEDEKEVIDRYKMIMSELEKRFTETLKSDLEAYKRHQSCIDIEFPPIGYKDWNDLTMGKRQFDDEDTISAIAEDGEIVTSEVNQDHEENVKRDEDEEQETTKRHSHR